MSAGPLRSQMGSDALQVRGGKLAALAHHVVADLLALVEGAHAGALDRGNMDEHVLSAVGGLDESEALLVVEKLNGTLSHVWPPVKTPIGAMAARPSRNPQSDFGVVLGCPAGRRQEQANIERRAYTRRRRILQAMRTRAFRRSRNALPMPMPLLVNLPPRDYIRGLRSRCRARPCPHSPHPGSFHKRLFLSSPVRSLAWEQTMSVFDYDAAAELFTSRRKFRTNRAAYMRFATAAEAIRHAVEVLPERAFLGTILEVDEERFDSEGIRRLDDASDYPLARQPAAVEEEPVQQASCLRA